MMHKTTQSPATHVAQQHIQQRRTIGIPVFMQWILPSGFARNLRTTYARRVRDPLHSSNTSMSL